MATRIIGRAVAARKASGVDDAAERGFEFRQSHWLVKQRYGLRPCALHVDLRRTAAHDHDRGSLVHAPDVRDDVPAIESGHDEIGDDRVGAIELETRNTFASVD